MADENPLWGIPRIQAELHLLGHDLAESTVAKYVERPRKPPSQSWRTFLANHAAGLAAIDFFTVPTITFRNLYVLVVLRHDRRRVVHFAVTEQPHAAWVAQQLKEAFPFDEAPRYLIRDNDGVFGHEVIRSLKTMGIEEIPSAFAASRDGAEHEPCGQLLRQRVHGILLGNVLGNVQTRAGNRRI